MIEVPRLILAAHSLSRLEALPRDAADADHLLFEPGVLALELLCQVVTSCPVSEQTALEHLDGPPDPVVDEGFQLSSLSICSCLTYPSSW